ncbi:MAG: amidase [Pseudomonadota bacterium]
MSEHDEICRKTIVEVAPLIESGSLSPVTLTEAMLTRIEAIDDRLNSYITVTRDLALAQAHRAEQEIAAGDYRGALHGIPLGIKDLVNIAGVKTTCASTIMADYTPDFSATVMENLNEAGAITLGKLNLTEFALYGYHPEYTAPSNPWNLAHWAGVSSSGSGAATGASLCFGAIGSDTGGSIRFPSAACGIVGIKPTFAKVSRHGVFPLADTLDHVGPMTRSVADAAIMLAAMEGRDERDPSTRCDPPGQYLDAIRTGVKGLRVGIDRDYCAGDTDPAMTAACFRALDKFADLGAEIIEFNRPEMVKAADHWMDTCAVDALNGHHDFYPAQRDQYGPVFRALLDHGAQVSAQAYAAGEKQRQATRALFDALFCEVDVIATPAMPTPAPPQSETPPQQVALPEDIAPLVRYAAPSDYSGNPSITFPNGFTDGGVPTAMQLIGNTADETTIIRAAYAYEQASEWFRMRPDEAHLHGSK